MGIIHRFKENTYGIGHSNSAECVCKPVKQTKYKGASSGRGGSHQGYKVSVEFHHNLLPAE